MSLNLNSNKSFKYYRKLEGSVIYISKWSSGGIELYFLHVSQVKSLCHYHLLPGMQKSHLFLGYLQCNNLTWSSQLSPCLVLSVSTFSGTL